METLTHLFIFPSSLRLSVFIPSTKQNHMHRRDLHCVFFLHSHPADHNWELWYHPQGRGFQSSPVYLPSVMHQGLKLWQARQGSSVHLEPLVLSSPLGQRRKQLLIFSSGLFPFRHGWKDSVAFENASWFPAGVCFHHNLEFTGFFCSSEEAYGWDGVSLLLFGLED